MSNLINTCEADFDKIVLQADKPVLVDFWANWCGPCRQLAPILEEVAQELADKAIIAKVNVDDNPELASKYAIRSIPTLLLFKNGELVDSMVGFSSKAQLVQFINK